MQQTSIKANLGLWGESFTQVEMSPRVLAKKPWFWPLISIRSMELGPCNSLLWKPHLTRTQLTHQEAMF